MEKCKLKYSEYLRINDDKKYINILCSNDFVFFYFAEKPHFFLCIDIDCIHALQNKFEKCTPLILFIV